MGVRAGVRILSLGVGFFGRGNADGSVVDACGSDFFFFKVGGFEYCGEIQNGIFCTFCWNFFQNVVGCRLVGVGRVVQKFISIFFFLIGYEVKYNRSNDKIVY